MNEISNLSLSDLQMSSQGQRVSTLNTNPAETYPQLQLQQEHAQAFQLSDSK